VTHEDDESEFDKAGGWPEIFAAIGLVLMILVILWLCAETGALR
jgi:hypothetical protein